MNKDTEKALEDSENEEKVTIKSNLKETIDTNNLNRFINNAENVDQSEQNLNNEE
jgi:hypothetical protein